jgi:hypothetical protein
VNVCTQLDACEKRVEFLVKDYPKIKERENILKHWQEYKKDCTVEKWFMCKYKKIIGY